VPHKTDLERGNRLESVDQVEIRRGLPEPYRRHAAELYYEGFRRKFEPVLNSPGQGVAILEEAFDPELAIIAVYQAQLAGIAGLQVGGHDFISFRTSAFARQYGWLRGLFKVLLLYFFFAERGSKGELAIESIVVHPAMRGKGIGTRLLKAVFDFARAKGFGSVRLEVVDTNPGARCLYERMGFVATKTRRYPYLRRMMGFSAVTTMVKQVT
jgi:ribosomal protein S18 acetylase RimI-like enzyme